MQDAINISIDARCCDAAMRNGSAVRACGLSRFTRYNWISGIQKRVHLNNPISFRRWGSTVGDDIVPVEDTSRGRKSVRGRG